MDIVASRVQRLKPWHWVLAGALVLVVLMVAALPLLGSSSATTTATCQAIGTINGLIGQGKYETASQVAQDTLQNLGPSCGPATHRQLASLGVVAALDAIRTAPAQPADATVQGNQLNAYHDLVELAQRYRVALPETRLQIAKDLYADQAFTAAAAAFTDAAQAGEMGPINTISLDNWRFIISTYYNAGVFYTNPGAPADSRATGLEDLVTSCRIDRARNAGSGLACARLQHLLGFDERTWPDPSATPLLAR